MIGLGSRLCSHPRHSSRGPPSLSYAGAVQEPCDRVVAITMIFVARHRDCPTTKAVLEPDDRRGWHASAELRAIPATARAARSPASPALWTTWASVRKVKEGETTNDLYAFLTTEPNAQVGAVHPKAMPVILTTPEEQLALLLPIGARAPCSERMARARGKPALPLPNLPFGAERRVQAAKGWAPAPTRRRFCSVRRPQSPEADPSSAAVRPRQSKVTADARMMILSCWKSASNRCRQLVPQVSSSVSVRTSNTMISSRTVLPPRASCLGPENG